MMIAIQRIFVKIPLEDIAAQNVQRVNGADSESDLRNQAAEWIGANRTMADEWLEKARSVTP